MILLYITMALTSTLGTGGMMGAFGLRSVRYMALESSSSDGGTFSFRCRSSHCQGDIFLSNKYYLFSLKCSTWLNTDVKSWISSGWTDLQSGACSPAASADGAARWWDPETSFPEFDTQPVVLTHSLLPHPQLQSSAMESRRRQIWKRKWKCEKWHWNNDYLLN